MQRPILSLTHTVTKDFQVYPFFEKLIEMKYKTYTVVKQKFRIFTFIWTVWS